LLCFHKYSKYQPEHRDEELEKHELQKQVSLGWDLDRLIRNYLKQDLLFTDQEIKNNIDLFKAAQKELDIMLEELGNLIGVQRAQISRIENGKNLTFSTIARVFKAMGISAKLEIGSMGKVALW
jgi:DNA-binding XRE family transcriptional regulator